MNAKKILLKSLFAGGMLALIRLASARPASSKVAPDHSPYAAVDAYVEEQMRRLSIPGAFLAIVVGDQIVHQRGFGRARPGGEPPSLQTPFFIGSLTKSITALGVMQLVETGKIELDAPVRRYLPWFRVAGSTASAQITVRHLLNQTSGLPALPGGLLLANFDDRPGATERQVRSLSKLKISYPVGSKCEYSNLNYNILGLILETVSGESYADYIQTHILTPLQMSHSYTSRTEARQNGLAVGHRHWFSVPFPAPDLPIPRGSLPSGQLISCAEDMAHYLIAHLNGGRYGDAQILSKAGVDELHRGVKDYIAMGNSYGKYAMGWLDIDLGQTKTYSHSGNVPDFSAFMALVPEQKKGVVLLFNADPYGLPPITGEVGMNLTAVLVGQPRAPFGLDFIRWVMRLLPLIPLFQVVGVAATLRKLQQWGNNPELRPSRWRVWAEQLLLPLIPDLTFVSFLVYLWTSGLLRYLHQFNPDIAWISRISGGFAGIWMFLRTGQILQVLRKSASSNPLL